MEGHIMKNLRFVVAAIFGVAGLACIGLGFTGGLMSLTFFIIGGSLLFTAAIWLMVGSMVGSLFGSSKLLQTGLPASAVVTSLRETGMVINNTNQVLHVGLRVQVGTGTPYDVVVKQAVPMMMMARIQPGATVGVRVDPADQANLVIDWSLVPGVNMQPAATGYASTPPAAYAQPQGQQPAPAPAPAPAPQPQAAYPQAPQAPLF
jgi:hypothetical protein